MKMYKGGWCIGDDIERLARKDAYLAALLNMWEMHAELSLHFVADMYLHAMYIHNKELLKYISLALATDPRGYLHDWPIRDIQISSIEAATGSLAQQAIIKAATMTKAICELITRAIGYVPPEWLITKAQAEAAVIHDLQIRIQTMGKY